MTARKTPFTVADALIEAEDHRIPIRRYELDGDGSNTARVPTLVWLHGGGFFRGSIDQPEADAVARALAARGLPVVTVDYRLAPLPIVGRANARGRRPRARFPIQIEDVLRVLRQEGSHDGGVILGGASAGACLAAGAALHLLEPGSDICLSGVVLAYGFFHSKLPRNAEIQKRVRGHRRVTHAPRFLDAANRNYAGSQVALGERSAFPGGHELRGFPAVLMVDADRDAMRASSEKFAAELQDAGVAVQRHVLPDSHHAFLNRPHLPEFATAIDRMAAWSLHRQPPENTICRD